MHASSTKWNKSVIAQGSIVVSVIRLRIKRTHHHGCQGEREEEVTQWERIILQ